MLPMHSLSEGAAPKTPNRKERIKIAEIEPHNRYMQIRLTEAEYEVIECKFRNSGLKSRSEFIRALIFEGYLIFMNENELKKLDQLIYNVANNIDQIAVRVNSTGNVYADDIAEIKEGQDKIWQQPKFFQSKFLSLTH